MLEVRGLSISYGKHRALEDVSIRVNPSEIVVILGANGAGKSTLLRAISGICEGRHTGAVEMEGHPILGLGSDRIVERGIALVPEGRGIFPDLTVAENLKLGAYANRARDDQAANMDRVLSLFPKLVERRNQVARTMSGGEQQMVAIGRAMMSNPQILMLDEPSLGLSPLLCKELFANLVEVRKTGIGILLVEQNAKQSLAIADRGYLLENAHVVHEDSAERLARDPAVQKAYLGAAAGRATAKASVEPVPTPVPHKPMLHPQPRRHFTADQLLGTSVDDLVASAARVSRPATRPAQLSDSVEPTSSGDQLRATLAGIERAAAEARGKRKTRHKAPAPVAVPSAQVAQDAPPVTIEVYRAPRIEVWRRRPGAPEFERN